MGVFELQMQESFLIRYAHTVDMIYQEIAFIARNGARLSCLSFMPFMPSEHFQLASCRHYQGVCIRNW